MLTKNPLKRLQFTTNFFITLAAVNLCFITIFFTSFFGIKNKMNFERESAISALTTSAEKNINQTFENLYVLGTDAANSAPKFTHSAEGYRANMSNCLSSYDFLYDIVYVTDSPSITGNNIFSCGKLNADILTKIASLDSKIAVHTLQFHSKPLIALSHMVYDANYNFTGTTYIIVNTNDLLDRFSSDFYSVELKFNESVVIEQPISANNNTVTTELHELPYFLSAKITVFPDTFTETGIGIISVIIALLIVAVLLNYLLIHSYKTEKSIIVYVKNQINDFFENTATSLNVNNIRDKDLRQLISEIDLLEKHSMNLSDQLDSYKQTIYEHELSQSKLKYFALKNQINPHFLYNTLACIKSIAICNKENEISEIASGMAKILKYNLSSENTATVTKEIEMIKAYLYIQSIRYYDSFSYSISIDEDIKNVEIMRFFLQPIVENAVIHGFSNSPTKGTITIRGELLDDCILFKISDSGIGIPPNILVQIKNNLENIATNLNNIDDKNSTSIGLANINSRIALFYGKDYGITINSAINSGTIVTVKLPINGSAEK